MKPYRMPVISNQRLESLDLLRGIALFGILVVNALQYFQPLGLANMPIRFVPEDDAMWPVWGLIHALFDMKFLTIFSLLFGLGFALQWERAQQGDDGSFKCLYLRRLLILAMFGLVHGVFLYAADVLVVYAVAGLVLLAFAAKDAGKLMRGGLILLLISVSFNDMLETPSAGLALRPILLYWTAFVGTMLLVRKTSTPVYLVVALLMTAGGSALYHLDGDNGYLSGPEYQLALELQRKQGRVDRNIALDRSRVEIDGQLLPMPPSRELQAQAFAGEVEAPTLTFLAYSSGPYGMETRARVDDFTIILLFGLIYFGWRTLGLYLIAAGLMKWGLVSIRNEGLWRRATWVGLGIGLPVSVITTVAWGQSYQAQNILTEIAPILHDLSSLLLATGLVGVALLWGISSKFMFLKTAFCNVGRVALSNYLGQSLIMSLLAGGYGLGWYGRLTHAELLGLSLLVFIILVAFSTLWLRRYRYGPLEWLWRCGTYWKILPNKIDRKGSSATP
jgi:uncharacterized protein